VRGSYRPGAQHDSIGSQVSSAVGADTFRTYRPPVGDPDAANPGVGEQRQVDAVHRRLQISSAGTNSGAPVDVQWNRSDTRR
jgi:hypothetical protein